MRFVSRYREVASKIHFRYSDTIYEKSHDFRYQNTAAAKLIGILGSIWCNFH